MLDLDANKLTDLKHLLFEYANEIEEIIGLKVHLKIVGVEKPETQRDWDEENRYIKSVKQAAMDLFNLKEDALMTSKKRPYPDMRGICYKIIKEKHPRCPLKKMGAEFGAKEHTTPLGALKSVNKLMAFDRELFERYTRMKTYLSVK